MYMSVCVFPGGLKTLVPMCPDSQGARSPAGPVPPLGCAFRDDLLLLIVSSRRQFHQLRFVWSH